MKHTQFKKRSNKTASSSDMIDIKPKNVVGKLNKKSRKEFFDSLDISHSLKPFWSKYKLHVSCKN